MSGEQIAHKSSNCATTCQDCKKKGGGGGGGIAHFHDSIYVAHFKVIV